MIWPNPQTEPEVSYLFRWAGARVALIRVNHGLDSGVVGTACDLTHALKARAWLT